MAMKIKRIIMLPLLPPCSPTVCVCCDRQTEVAHLWKNRWQPEVGCVSPVLENSD